MAGFAQPGCKPRLLFFSASLYGDAASGAALSCLDLLELLSSRGWRCYVLCGTRLSFEEPKSLRSFIDHQQVHYQTYPNVLGTLPVFLHSFAQGSVAVTACELTDLTQADSSTSAEEQALLALFDQVIERCPPDIVLTSEANRLTKEIATRAQGRGIPAVCALHRVEELAASLGRSMDAALVSSRFAQESYRSQFKLECTAIPGPWNWARVRCADSQGKCVTFVNPHPTKGCFPFVRCVVELGRRRPDIPILVVEGRATASRLQHAGLDLRGLNNLYVMAHTTDPRDFYQVSRLVLVPALRQDAVPRVAVEALINGIPVLGSRRGALSETLEQGGFLLDLPAHYTPESPLAPTAEEMAPWVDLIIRLWDDKALYDSERQRCWAAAEEWRSFRLGDRYERFFATVLRGQAHLRSWSSNVLAATTVEGAAERGQSLDTASTAPIVVAKPQAKPARVSLCMIVKNEEHNLPDCLRSVADLVAEVIVVDTGSTDRTKEAARGFGARVYDFPWVDSFAAARNESLRHATGDWVFCLDADHRFDTANRQRLRDLFAALPDGLVAYVMGCRNLQDPEEGTGTEVDLVRLFRNHPEARWQYRAHEQILPSLRRLGGEIRRSDVLIHHIGYESKALRMGKQLLRDRRLLEMSHAEDPDDPFILFHLGWHYFVTQGPADALPWLRWSLERSHPGDSTVRQLYRLIALCHRQLGQHSEVLSVCQDGHRHFPDDEVLLFQEGQTRRKQNDLAGAERCLVRLLGSPDRQYLLLGGPTDLRGHKGRNELALVYRAQGRVREAEAQWLAVVAEHPTFAWAWYGLGGLYLELGNWPAVERIIQTLEAAGTMETPGPVLAVALQARLFLAKRDYTSAREMLQRAVARFPEEEVLWVVLSHVLLQENKDLAEAERVLHKVLELAPNHAEATANLRVLLHR